MACETSFLAFSRHADTCQPNMYVYGSQILAAFFFAVIFLISCGVNDPNAQISSIVFIVDRIHCR